MSDQRLLSKSVAAPSEPGHHRVCRHWTSFFAHLDETVVWLVDAAGMVTYASPSVRRWLGHEPSGLLGKPLELLCHPDEALAFVVALGRCTAATPGSAVQ